MPPKLDKSAIKKKKFLDILRSSCCDHEITLIGAASIAANVEYFCQGDFSPTATTDGNRRGHFQLDEADQQAFETEFGSEAWSTENQLEFFFKKPSNNLLHATYDRLMAHLTLPEYTLNDATKAICRLVFKPTQQVNMEELYELAGGYHSEMLHFLR
jgi:hypothetical protein